MTDEPTKAGDPHPGQDPLRALDAVTAPDQWADITERAERDADLSLVATAPPRSHRPLLVAAALLVVIGLAGAIALTRNDDRGSTGVSTAPSPDLDPSGDVLGRVWNLTGFTVDGAAVGTGTGTETDGVSGPTGPVNLDLSRDGSVGFTACNAGEGHGGVEGDRLVVGNEWLATAAGCAGPGGEALMALDESMAHFLQSDPTIELRGNELTLRSGNDVATFVDRDAGPDDGVASQDPIPDGDSTCLLELRAPRDSALDPKLTELQPGPSDPPIPEVSDVSTPGTSGTWHVSQGQQRAEIHVPGVIVRDLVGERTEQVDLPDRGPATVWFTQDWVQVRYFPGTRERDGCSSFDVTVMGGTEQANRDLAVGLAERVLTTARQITGTTDTTTAEAIPPYSRPTTPTVSSPLEDPGGPTTGSSPEAPVSNGLIVDGDSTCAVAWEPPPDVLGPTDHPLLEPGPSEPPLLESRPTGSSVPGVWHQDQTGQRAEIHVPANGDRGPTGAYAEKIDLQGQGAATLLFAGPEDAVQLDYVSPGRDPGPCGSFTVIVGGGDETANRLYAVYLAERLVTGER